MSMLGCIGVAIPATKCCRRVRPGSDGDNMDYNDLMEDATLYFLTIRAHISMSATGTLCSGVMAAGRAGDGRYGARRFFAR